MKSLTDWLAGLTGISEVKAVQVAIGHETFKGARYVATRHYDSGMMAVQRGDKKAGESYTQEYIYLLGARPVSHRRSSRIAYRLTTGDTRDWYVACHLDGPVEAKFADYHPFGANFLLSPWEVPSGEAIDHYDTLVGKKPYKRVDAQVTEE